MDTLKFSFTGDFITEFSRKKYMETGSIELAKDVLTQMLVDFPRDIAQLVITGKKKIVGVNEVTIEDDDQVIEPYCWIKPSDITKCACGWIAPNGDVFGGEVHTMTTEHDDLAVEIIKRGNVIDDERSHERSVEVAGYILFQPRLIVASCLPSLITETQRDRVIDFMESHGIKSIQVGYGASDYTNIGIIKSMDILMFANKLISMITTEEFNSLVKRPYESAGNQ